MGGGPHTFACLVPSAVVTSSRLSISKNVILDGEGNLVIDGNGTHQVLSISFGVTAESTDR
jgi:hypothetical protein